MANLITGLRIIVSAALLFCPVFSPIFYVLYLIAGYIIGNDAKTESGKRDIPFSSEVRQLLREQQKQNEVLLGKKWKGTLFPSVEGELLREYTVNREIKRICKTADIEPFTCHAFRITFATRFIEQRPEDYKILSDIMGHKDIAITLNLYTRVMQEKKVSAMKAIKIRTN